MTGVSVALANWRPNGMSILHYSTSVAVDPNSDVEEELTGPASEFRAGALSHLPSITPGHTLKSEFRG
jgi:hypothetical protein